MLNFGAVSLDVNFYFRYVLYAVLGTYAWQQRLGPSQDTDYLPYQDTFKVSRGGGRERGREGGREGDTPITPIS